MHFSDDRTRYKLLKKISYSSEDNKSTIPERHVLYLAEPKQCRNCGGTCFLRKDQRPRKPFMDYIDGTLVNIVVYKQRFVCKFCGKISSAGNSADFDKKMRARKAALDLLTDKNQTMEKLAQQGGFSHASGSAALHTLMSELNEEIKTEDAWIEDPYAERVAKLREMIRSFQTKQNLAFIPFVYEQKWRCLVCTWDPAYEDAYLLDILESTDLTLTKKIHSRIADKGIIETVFCDVDEKTFHYMIQEYPFPTDVIFARFCMRNVLKRYYTERLECEVRFSHKPYNQLFSIVCKAFATEWEEKWHEWLKQLSCEQEMISEDIKRFIERNYEEVDAAFYHDYSLPFITLINEISKFQNNSFELMRMRMLFANRSHFDKSYEPDLIYAINHIHAPIPQMPITNFGVRISDLVAELRAERENITME